MSFAFFVSLYLKYTPFSFISPYFDQVIAVLVIVFMLPESIGILWRAIKKCIFLFSPDEAYIDDIKVLCQTILKNYEFIPVFDDVTKKTGRHLWIAIYFQIEEEMMVVDDLDKATKAINGQLQQKYLECTCELILIPQQ